MHTICKVDGTLRGIEDGGGETVDKDWVRPVRAHLKYKLRPSPVQPLIAEIYGRHIWGFGGATYELSLDNGVVLTGRVRSYGSLTSNEIQRSRMLDVREPFIALYPDDATSTGLEIDTVMFGVVSSAPLASGACTSRGWASPGRPFLFIEGPLPEERSGRKLTWAGGSTLRISHRGFEIWFWPTSKYWRNLVDAQTLQHDSIVCIRRESGELITWEEFNELRSLIEAFMGWVNHCVSPAYHVKAYRKRRLVYRAYKLHPHPTVQRDLYSWLPKYGPDEGPGRHGDMVNHLFAVFSKKWVSRTDDDMLHIALQFLRSKEKGGPRSRPSLLYLRDAFGAISILTSMLVPPNRGRSRHQTMVRCIKLLRVPDEIPDSDGRRYLSNHHRELWSSESGAVQEKERRGGRLSRPLANLQNWLLHLDNPQNASRLLGLSGTTQRYFVEVAAWLADLMLMKVVVYEGTYLNRLTGNVEAVPWVDECKWSQ